MGESAQGVQNEPSQSLLTLATESWRFARLFSKVIERLDAGESPRYASQLRYFLKRIEESLQTENLKLINLEGQLYDAGVAATALNIADFGPDDRLVVEQMIEPIVMGPNGIVKPGTVMLRKAN